MTYLYIQKFIDKYSDSIHGVIDGFDRIILKGYIGNFYYGNNFHYFLAKESVKLKRFKDYAQNVRGKIKSHVEKIASETGAYTDYLNSPKKSKEDIAKRVAEERGIKEGLICILSAVEPCMALSVEYNSTNKN